MEKRLKDFINEVKLYDDFSNEYFDKTNDLLLKYYNKYNVLYFDFNFYLKNKGWFNKNFDKKFIGTINKIEPLENESTNKQKHLIRHYSIE